MKELENNTPQSNMTALLIIIFGIEIRQMLKSIKLK